MSRSYTSAPPLHHHRCVVGQLFYLFKEGIGFLDYHVVCVCVCARARSPFSSFEPTEVITVSNNNMVDI
jgi:hypothetical protein